MIKTDVELTEAAAFRLFGLPEAGESRSAYNIGYDMDKVTDADLVASIRAHVRGYLDMYPAASFSDYCEEMSGLARHGGLTPRPVWAHGWGGAKVAEALRHYLFSAEDVEGMLAACFDRVLVYRHSLVFLSWANRFGRSFGGLFPGGTWIERAQAAWWDSDGDEAPGSTDGDWVERIEAGTELIVCADTLREQQIGLARKYLRSGLPPAADVSAGGGEA